MNKILRDEFLSGPNVPVSRQKGVKRCTKESRVNHSVAPAIV